MTVLGRRPRHDYRYWANVTLRWSDNDAYGHVNNTVYYQWFDTAINEWLIKRGLLDVQAGDLIGLVAATACDYLQPLSYPGSVEIGLQVERIGNSSVTYRLGVFAPGSAEPAAQGRFVHVYVDRTLRRPVALSDEWKTILAEIS